MESDTEGINPLVSVTKIDPKEIPEVTNKFLMRGERPKDDDDKSRKSEDRNGSENRRERNFGWSKRQVPQSRSGRIIKGRGNFRYRTPSRSRSRSFTPEHWKAATRKLIKYSEYEKFEEEKRKRDDEIKRRMEERKKRHEALQRGDGKKSFFELTQETTVARVDIAEKEPDRSNNEELDYEEDIVDEEIPKKDVDEPKSRKDEKSSPDRGKIRIRRSRSRSSRRSRSRSSRRDRDHHIRRDFGDLRNRNNRYDRFRRDDRDKDRNRNDDRNNDRDRRDRDRDRRRNRSRSRSR